MLRHRRSLRHTLVTMGVTWLLQQGGALAELQLSVALIGGYPRWQGTGKEYSMALVG